MSRSRTRVEVRPIHDDNLQAVGEFLEVNLNDRVAAVDWARALQVPWGAEQPNCGFMLMKGSQVVGVQLAFYSTRRIDGRPERFCNLGAWCVLPEHRIDGLRLLKAALAQGAYHFTDLSPSGNVVAINAKLGFRFIDSTTVLIPNLPWLSMPGRGAIVVDPARIERLLSGSDLELYRDHAAAPAAHHLVLISGNQYCYVIFREDRRRGLPLFATVLYVGNAQVFSQMARPLARHMLIHHRVAATLLEATVSTLRPRLSWTVSAPRRRMFRSPSLEPAQVDYLYSELVCVPW